MKTIYETKGAAKEYCDLAVDIYEYCPHKCKYCYEKAKVERKGNEFSFKGARENVIEETRKYLEEHKEIYGKMIFLGFSSDPFPSNEDISKTLDMIKLLKEFNCKVMFCTKGSLNNEIIKECIRLSDSIGITLTCGDEMAAIYEPYASKPSERIKILEYAKKYKKETWISFEPVLEPKFILDLLDSNLMDIVDIVKLGKLNHMNISDLTGKNEDVIDWKDYGNKAIEICKKRKINYMVKYALGKEL